MTLAVEPHRPVLRTLAPAGFWRRAVALVMDWLWLFCALGVAGWLLFGIAIPSAPAGPGGLGTVALMFHQLVPALVFIVGWTRYGATPGKILLELRVVDARTGAHAAWPQALVRYLGYFVSALPLGLGFLWAAWDRRKQALHDKLARTEVVVVAEEVMPGVAV